MAGVNAETSPLTDQVKPCVGSGPNLFAWVMLGAALAGVPINQAGKPGNVTIAPPTVGGQLIFSNGHGRQLTVSTGQNGHDWMVDDQDAGGNSTHYQTTGRHALGMILELMVGQPS